jgi:hypothetical protein
MGLLDLFGAGNEGGGILGGIGRSLRDAAPVMSAYGRGEDMGMAQLRSQQMQARRQQQQEEEFQKQAASALAQKMGLPPELASSPESVFSLARSMKLAEEERKNRRPERVSMTDQWLQKLRQDDPVKFNQIMEQQIGGGGSQRKTAEIEEYEYEQNQRKGRGLNEQPIDEWRATRRPRSVGELPPKVVSDMGERGTAIQDQDRYATTFKDSYGGKGVFGFGGELANSIARKDLGVGDKEAAGWWQDYDRHKNVVRNQLFGSALTAPEKQAFEAADITPGMDPAMIRNNLRVQNEAARRAAKKLADYYVKTGRPTEQIEAAMGVPLSSLDAPPPAPPAGGGAGETVIDGYKIRRK